MRNHQTRGTVLQIAVQLRFLQRRGPHHNVDVMQMRERQQSLDITIRKVAMLHIEPDAVETKMCSLLDEGGDVVPQATHSDELVLAKAGQSLAVSHRDRVQSTEGGRGGVVSERDIPDCLVADDNRK